MDLYIFFALITVLLNIVLSSTIPVLLQNYDSNEPIINDMKKIFNNNKQLIISNSIILGITVYIALHIANKLETKFTDFTGIPLENPDESFYNDIKIHQAAGALVRLSGVYN
jgi:hypothetical protein